MRGCRGEVRFVVDVCMERELSPLPLELEYMLRGLSVDWALDEEEYVLISLLPAGM